MKNLLPCANAKKVRLVLAGAKNCATNNFQKNSTDVFVEFALPQDESYGLVLNLVRLDIVDWATRYNIPYTQKTIK